MKLKRYQKWLIRLTVYLFITLLVLGLICYFYPLSGKWLNRRLEEALEQQVGRKFEVKEAKLLLSRGNLNIGSMSILPPGEEGEPFPIKNATLEFYPDRLFRSRPGALRSLTMSTPVQIKIMIKNGRPVPDPRYSHLISLFQKEGGGGSGSLPRIVMDAGGLEIYPFGGSRNEPLFALSPLVLDIQTEGGNITNISARANLHSEVVSPLSGQVIFIPGKIVQVDLNLNHFLLSEESFPESDFRLDIQDFQAVQTIEMANVIEWTSDWSSGDSNIKIPRIREAFRENRITLKSSGQWNFTNPEIVLEECDLTLGNSSISLNGFYQPYATGRFYAVLNQKPVSQIILNKAKDLMLLPGFHATFLPESVNLSMQAEGEASYPDSITLTGKMDFSRVVLRHEDYPLPLTNLSGSILLQNRNLLIPSISGNLGDGSINLKGRISGDPELDHADKIEMRWDSDLSIRDILLLLKSKLVIPELHVDGMVHSRGITVIDVFRENGETSATLETFEADVSLKDGYFSHNILPVPVNDINAEIRVTPAELSFHRIQGRLNGAMIEAVGSLSGNNSFWESPKIKGDLQYRGSLRKIISVAGGRPEKMADQMQLDGSTTMTISVSGSPYEPKDLFLSGRTIWSDASFELNQEHVTGMISDWSGLAEFDRNHFMLHDTRFNFAGMPFSARGSLDNEKIELSCTGNIKLQNLLEAAPALANEFRGTGTLQMTTEAMLATPEMKKFLLNRETEKQPSFTLTGSILPGNLSFAHRDMPADLDNIKGRITFNEKGLNWDDVTLDCGKSKNCRSTGQIRLGEPARTNIKYELRAPEFHFDEWVEGSWGLKRGQKISSSSHMSFPDRPIPMIFVDGQVRTDRFHFQGLQGGFLDGELTYRGYRGAPNLMNFSIFGGAAYDGALEGTGSFEFISNRPFSWRVSGKVNQLQINPVLNAFRGSPEKFFGRLNATVSLSGVSGETETISGESDFEITDARISENPILKRIGNALKSNVLNDIRFRSISGEAEFEQNAARFEEIIFDNPVISLSVSGRVDFQENVDAMCYLIFERGFLRKVPGLSQLAKILEVMGGLILKYQITGTIPDPKIEPVTFSSDEIRRFF